MRDTLAALKKNGIKIAIGSSSKTNFILERVGLLHEFGAVADGMDIVRCKPDPEVFLLSAKRIGVQPSDCMVVEDAEAGIEAAVSGGFVPVAVSDAKSNKKLLIASRNYLTSLPL